MKELLIFIYEQLASVHERVYFEQAEENAKYPYIVYNLPTSMAQESKEVFILEVDIWDKTTDTTQLETLTQAIDNKLGGLRHVEEHFNCRINRINRLMIPDPIQLIRRRQLRYEINAQLR